MEIIKFERPHWIQDGLIFYTPKYFQSNDDIKNSRQREVQMLGQAKSKFPNCYVLDSNLWDSFESDEENILVSIASFGKTEVVFIDLNKKLIMNELDILTMSSSVNIKIFGEYYLKKLKYSTEKKVFGSGSKTFEITATIRDDYKIKVNAETKEEALALANEVSISDWDHPDIEPHLSHRKIIRHARWGNLSVEEIV